MFENQPYPSLGMVTTLPSNITNLRPRFRHHFKINFYFFQIAPADKCMVKSVINPLLHNISKLADLKILQQMLQNFKVCLTILRFYALNELKH